METIRIENQSEQAEIIPGFGCQCVRYAVGGLELIAQPASFEELAAHPHRFGIPVLFPWPGRIAGARLDWGSHHQDLPVTEAARGHAIHGVVSTAPFTVVRRGPYYLTCELDWTAQPEWRQQWPFPFRLALDYEIGNGLRITATVHNLGEEPMPFGLGFHPYFNLPAAPAPGSAEARFRLPVASRMTLDETMIPTGGAIRLPASHPWITLDGSPFDDLFDDGVADPDGKFRAYIAAPGLPQPVSITADPDFSTWVAFVPPGRAVLAVEPYTCLPDAFHLAQRGIKSGVLELAPHKSWQGTIELGLGSLPPN